MGIQFIRHVCVNCCGNVVCFRGNMQLCFIGYRNYCGNVLRGIVGRLCPFLLRGCPDDPPATYNSSLSGQVWWPGVKKRLGPKRFSLQFATPCFVIALKCYDGFYRSDAVLLVQMSFLALIGDTRTRGFARGRGLTLVSFRNHARLRLQSASRLVLKCLATRMHPMTQIRLLFWAGVRTAYLAS